jgi:hypothetical protein
MAKELIIYLKTLVITLIIFSILYLALIWVLKKFYIRSPSRNNSDIYKWTILLTPIFIVVVVYLVQIIRIQLVP